MNPAQQPRAERDRDIVDPAAAALMRVRRGAEARGEGRLHGAAAKANLRSFGAAMEALTASPVRRRDAERDSRCRGTCRARPAQRAHTAPRSGSSGT